MTGNRDTRFGTGCGGFWTSGSPIANSTDRTVDALADFFKDNQQQPRILPVDVSAFSES
ncbi:hypothetical protein PN498_19195 [Oscillatoria sp. CS-180]|uniref:hypothetical protein n=1 Tax=Oscillatoria sp. CS-180 TaxID=3021720 RepID=UPI00232FC050|nr:hypothetical protein [Oscillatoria sp. CS-180]MDB9528127.1 hypothetical protein [Oscillatoria sp. CS-180]